MDKRHLAAAREVNRQLRDKVRDSWDYGQSGDNDRIAHTPAAVRTYRDRFYGTTDDSAGESGEPGGESRSDRLEDMYTFDSPDSVGADLERRRQERRKRKRKLLEEEVEYNGGLCTFLMRRNAWTGAVSRVVTNSETDSSASPQTPHRIISSSESSHAPTPTSTSPSSKSPNVGDAEDASVDSVHPDLDPVVPVAEPIMSASHPVRQTLSSRSHSELYEKLVRDSRTPAIPINLSEMMHIVVQGWKDEGSWPPKGSVPEPPIAGRRNRVAKKLGMRDESAAAGGGGSRGLSSTHKHLRQSVEGVKRIFRLSGDHSGTAHPKSPKSGSFGNQEHVQGQ